MGFITVGVLVFIHDKSNDNVMISITMLLTCLHVGGEWFSWAARGGRSYGMILFSFFFICKD